MCCKLSFALCLLSCVQYPCCCPSLPRMGFSEVERHKGRNTSCTALPLSAVRVVLYASPQRHASALRTQILELVPHPQVEVHQWRNLRAALAASLLRLPLSFSEEDLFSELCGLSYRGDIRTLLRAEDPNKVCTAHPCHPL